MQIKEERIQYLYQQYLKRKLSPSELDEFKILVNQDCFEEIIGDQLDLEWDAQDTSTLHTVADHQMAKIYSDIRKRIRPNSSSRIRILYRRFIPYAAILTVIIAFGYWVWNQNTMIETPTILVLNPGTNQATLTLQDGQTIQLREDQDGIIIGDTLTYQDGTTLQAKSQIYKLDVPLGGQYQVTLPDGSHVWLNAGSSLRYPSKFDADQRLIELKGEAYFKVKKQANHARFFVKTVFETVEVLGTEFNITAYPEDLVSMTTLVTGSVKVENINTSQSVNLVPGQQAFQNDQNLAIRNVNIQDFTAWREGVFRFNDESLENIMKNLSRWYNVEVIFQHENLKNETFTGNFARRNNASHILNGLEKTGNVQFNIKSGKIHIDWKPKK